VAPSNIREYGRANLSFIKDDEAFFEEVALNSQVWMSHSDTIKQLPTNGVLLASTKDVANAAYRIEGENTYAIQFHPEVYHSTDGKQILENFLVKIAEVPQNFTPNAFVEDCVIDLQEKVKDDKVVLGLSGGVDSTVAAVLLNKAIGKNLYWENDFLYKYFKLKYPTLTIYYYFMFSCFCSSTSDESVIKDVKLEFTEAELRDFYYVAQKYEEVAARDPEIQRIRKLYSQERMKLEKDIQEWRNDYFRRQTEARVLRTPGPKAPREISKVIECPICYEKKTKTEFKSTACGHFFFNDFLEEVLRIKPCCPLFRYKI
jgi:anthranilate/para-aminobenzoate synthase component II